METSSTFFDRFLQGERFELHSYLTYLFNQISDYFPEHAEEKMENE